MTTLRKIIAEPPVARPACRISLHGHELSIQAPKLLEMKLPWGLLGIGLVAVVGSYFWGGIFLAAGAIASLLLAIFRRLSDKGRQALYTLSISPNGVTISDTETTAVEKIALDSLVGRGRLVWSQDANSLYRSGAARSRIRPPSIFFLHESGGHAKFSLLGLFPEWKWTKKLSGPGFKEVDWVILVVNTHLNSLLNPAPEVDTGATIALDQARANLLAVLRNAPTAVASPFEIDSEFKVEAIADTSAW